MKTKLNEEASEGSTSAGNIASVPGLNFPLQRRMPPSNLFGYTVIEPEPDKKEKKED